VPDPFHTTNCVLPLLLRQSLAAFGSSMRAPLIACVAAVLIGTVVGSTSNENPGGDHSTLATEKESAPKTEAGQLPPKPCVLGEVPHKSAKDVGFTQRWGELSEKARLKLRTEAGWQWKFPGESPAYAAMQEKRYDEIQGLYHFQERLDNWVQYVQVYIFLTFVFVPLSLAVADPSHVRIAP